MTATFREFRITLVWTELFHFRGFHRNKKIDRSLQTRTEKTEMRLFLPSCWCCSCFGDSVNDSDATSTFFYIRGNVATEGRNGRGGSAADVDALLRRPRPTWRSKNDGEKKIALFFPPSILGFVVSTSSVFRLLLLHCRRFWSRSSSCRCSSVPLFNPKLAQKFQTWRNRQHFITFAKVSRRHFFSEARNDFFSLKCFFSTRSFHSEKKNRP